MSRLAYTQVTLRSPQPARVVGGVQDASAAAVSGAELRLENTATQIIQKTVAADDGGFVFPSVQPGVYKLTAVMKGFETAVYTNIVVTAARTTNQPITLKVGSVNETVEISGAAPALQLSTATISNTVEQKYLQDLPLPRREALPFALLAAGAQQGVTARDSTFEGMPGASINITLNGISNNAQRFKSGGTSFFNFVANRLEARPLADAGCEAVRLLLDTWVLSELRCPAPDPGVRRAVEGAAGEICF